MAAKGLSDAGKDIVKHLGKMSTAIERGRKDTLVSAAKVATAEHLKVIRRDSGGDLKLSNVGRRKGKPGGRGVGARYEISKTGKHRATVSATGPLPLIANDIDGHVIRSAYVRGALRKSKGQSQVFGPAIGKASGVSRRTVLATPFGWRQTVRHPGTKGKDTWNKGAKRAAPAISKVMESELANIVTRGFK